MNSQHLTPEGPIRLESARQRVVAAVTALSKELETAAVAPQDLKAQQALIIAGLERLVDEPEPEPPPERAEPPAGQRADEAPLTD